MLITVYRTLCSWRCLRFLQPIMQYPLPFYRWAAWTQKWERETWPPGLHTSVLWLSPLIPNTKKDPGLFRWLRILLDIVGQICSSSICKAEAHTANKTQNVLILRKAWNSCVLSDGIKGRHSSHTLKAEASRLWTDRYPKSKTYPPTPAQSILLSCCSFSQHVLECLLCLALC